jgi:hypothetical protein
MVKMGALADEIQHYRSWNIATAATFTPQQ